MLEALPGVSQRQTAAAGDSSSRALRRPKDHTNTKGCYFCGSRALDDGDSRNLNLSDHCAYVAFGAPTQGLRCSSFLGCVL